MGSTPASSPTQNRGLETAGLQRLGLVLRQLEQALPLLGSTSPAGKEVIACINRLSKHVPMGTVNPTAEKNQIEQLALRNAQQAGQAAQMRQAPPQPGAP